MNKIVQSARKYLGVRFRHRGRNRHGLDCAGLVVVTYRDLGIDMHDSRHYGREPANDGLVSHAVSALGEPVKLAPVSQSDLQIGDVVLRRYVENPHHAGIVTDYPYGGAFGIIHADGQNGKVVEHRLAPDVIAAITHVFRRPV